MQSALGQTEVRSHSHHNKQPTFSETSAFVWSTALLRSAEKIKPRTKMNSIKRNDAGLNTTLVSASSLEFAPKAQKLQSRFLPSAKNTSALWFHWVKVENKSRDITLFLRLFPQKNPGEVMPPVLLNHDLLFTALRNVPGEHFSDTEQETENEETEWLRVWWWKDC